LAVREIVATGASFEDAILGALPMTASATDDARDSLTTSAAEVEPRP